MGVTFGPGARAIRVLGDFVLAYHWINDEPAMVIYPRRRKLNGGAYIVCLSAAHRYTDIDYLVLAAKKACEIMHVGETYFTINKLIDVFLEGLEDLVKMPPNPQQENRPALDVTRRNGEIRISGEIDVPFGTQH